ncbi:hypothetical protein F3Y22_tig00109948pilonHSYRG00078 [Hibiscus syriacus]|uniref:Protein FAR1-RELATED SEQUENCE n=1 Tax=Hibiscus syriacus TaxID=106335 RepID=A0A6A3BX13_HIBSY|nr:hypothetical protein F3Y22_tig00109948pilonHSYRG00078 [Hibiscus syriacus]
MDHTDVDNVNPTEECHEVHNVDEFDRLIGQLFCSRDQAWYFYKGFVREHEFSARKGTTRLDVEGNVKTQEFCCSKERAVSKADIDEATTLKEVGVGTSQVRLIFNGVRLFQNSTSKSIHGCESMNASLAIALKHKKTYLDVRAIEDGISRMRMNELKADYLSSHTKPFQIIKLVDLESHAAAIFTRESFRAFQDELIRETLYRIEAEIKSLLDEYRWTSVSPQLHILKHLDYTYLPGTLIQSRWTNDAKASAPSYVDMNVSPEVMQMARFAALRSTSSRLCYIASKTDESFKTARDEMKKLIEELENSFGLNDSVNQSIVVNNVRDPQRKQRKRKEVPKNKVEKKIRRCGYCNGEGHNKLTCPQVKLSLSTSTQPTSTDFSKTKWNDNDLHIS